MKERNNLTKTSALQVPYKETEDLNIHETKRAADVFSRKNSKFKTPSVSFGRHQNPLQFEGKNVVGSLYRVMFNPCPTKRQASLQTREQTG